MKTVSILACLALLLAAVPAQADDAAVTPFIGDTTVAVVRLDAKQVDLDALKAWHNRIYQETFGKQPTPENAGLTTMLPVVRQAIDAMKKVGGGVAYVVFNLDMHGASSVLVIPVTTGTDTTDLSTLLLKHGGPAADPTLETATISHALVYGPMAAVEQMKVAQPTTRPEMMAALAAAPGAPVNIAFAPPAALKILAMAASGRAQGFMATLLGPVLQNMDWLSISATLPPNESLNLTLEARDAQAAQTIAGSFQPLIDQLAKNADATPMAKLLTPVQKGSALTVDIPTEAMEKIVIPMVEKEIKRVVVVRLEAQSMNNMRQLLLGCVMYSNEHHDQWPDKLDDISSSVPNLNQLMDNPARPGVKPGYIYVKPSAAAAQAPDQVIVLYEPIDGKQFVAVGYEDGHAQLYSADKAAAVLKGVGK